MSVIYDERAVKKATNVTVNSDLLQKAKSYNINLSKNFETYLVEIVKQKEAEKWLEENREAIEKQNERIRRRGSFSDGVRRF